MRTIDRDIVAAVLRSKDGKILQALQTPGGHGAYPGCWGLIGGGINTGEDQRTALDREMREETGIDISRYPAEIIDESTGQSEKTLKETSERVAVRMKFYTYEVIIADKKAEEIPVTLDDEHSEYRWCDVSELKHMHLAHPSIALFTKLGYL